MAAVARYFDLLREMKNSYTDAVVNFAAETHVDRGLEDATPSSNKRAGDILSIGAAKKARVARSRALLRVPKILSGIYEHRQRRSMITLWRDGN
jgi:hypothetical protein